MRITQEMRAEANEALWPSARWEIDIAEPETEDQIWALLAGGTPLKKICKEQGWPYSIVMKWKNGSPERQQRYNNALAEWADSLAQEAIGIADAQQAIEKKDGTVYDPEVPRDKLRVDTRLKLAAKLDRERYGDAMTLTGKGGSPLFQPEVDDLELARRLAYILTTSSDAIEKAAESSREEVSKSEA